MVHSSDLAFLANDIGEGFLSNPYFEIPRGDGINDSFSTYVSQVSQDPDLQKSTLEGIFDFYGSQGLQESGPWVPDLRMDQIPGGFSS